MVCVVGEADIPDPGRAASVQSRRHGVGDPAVIGRRKLVLFDRPIAISPFWATPMAVAIDAIDSAIEA